MVRLDIMKARGARSLAAGSLKVRFNSGAVLRNDINDVAPANCVKTMAVVTTVASDPQLGKMNRKRIPIPRLNSNAALGTPYL
jgi:hypothetical protein